MNAVAPTGAEQPASSSASTSALGEHRGPGRAVVDGLERALELPGAALAAHLDRERALAGRGGPVGELEELGRGIRSPEAPRPGGGEHHRVESCPTSTRAEPRVDVAADVDDLEVGAGRAQLRDAARRARCRRGRRAGSSRA